MNIDLEHSTTGSFQNQPTPAGKASRKRGMSEFLSDCTNLQDHQSRRVCKTRAESSIHQLTATHAPRGNPQAGGVAKVLQSSDELLSAAGEPSNTASSKRACNAKSNADTPTHLAALFKNSKEAVGKGADILMSYILRNASYEVQKAYAISVMATAMTTWGCRVTDAAKIASEYTSLTQKRFVAGHPRTSFHSMACSCQKT